MTTVRLTRAALRDLEVARDHLLEAAGVAVALRFIERVEQAQDVLARFPDSGASWSFVAAGLRRWNLAGFPYGLFYRNHGTTVLILRVLHTSRDIPATLREG